ncbi:MAG: glycosyltransferase [Lachnospiraceae bacterium]|nr:glycosyltransferase [Lachnospiraceae bacterium]
MTEEVLVSVIIPVYNVEQYLDRCIQSVVDQSYHNLEIILVDDGSKDSSGKKVDEWSEVDNRIVPIHRVNGGLSAARNTGIAAARGEYILFVDSDDWIHTDMIYSMVCNLSKAEIVSCGMIRATDTECIPIEWFDKEMVISAEEAIDLLVDNTIFTSHVIRNMYPRGVFDTIKFPEGRIFEDIRVTHKLFQMVKKICIIPDAYYYYYVRDNSISNVVKLKNKLEWYDALKERADDLINSNPEYQEKIKAQMAVVISLAMVQDTFTETEKKEFKNDIDDVHKFLKDACTKKSVKKYASKSQYLYYMIARIFSFSANKVYRIIRG